MKKVISTILAAASLSLAAPAAMAAEFSDLPREHWAYDAVSELSEAGIISGRGDGTFDPESLVTRAEFVKMADTSSEETEPVYADVTSEHWGFAFVQGSGLEPDENGNFRPDEAITREDAARVMWIAAGSPAGMTAPEEFTSQSDTPQMVAWIFSSGIMQGSGGSDLRLGDTITRAEAAAVISRGRRIIHAYENGVTNGEFAKGSYTISSANIEEVTVTNEDGTESVTYKYNPVSADTPIRSYPAGYPEQWERYPYIIETVPNEIYDSEYEMIPDTFTSEEAEDPTTQANAANSFADLYLSAIGQYIRYIKDTHNVDMSITYYPSLVWDYTGHYYVYRVKCVIDSTNGQELTYKTVFEEENDTVLYDGMTFWTDITTDYAFGMGVGALFGFGNTVFVDGQ